MTRNQIEYWRLVETNRNNLAVEQETKRANLAREKETNRSNLAREKETFRSNLANEQMREKQLNQNLYLTRIDQQERARANRAQEKLESKRQEEAHRANVQAEIARNRQATVSEMNARTNARAQDESVRANRAREMLTGQQISETRRTNLANEAVKAYSAQEQARSNRSREGILINQYHLDVRRQNEQERSNLARETEAHRANVAKERNEILKIVMPLVSDNLGTIERQARNASFNLRVKASRLLNTLKGVSK